MPCPMNKQTIADLKREEQEYKSRIKVKVDALKEEFLADLKTIVASLDALEGYDPDFLKDDRFIPLLKRLGVKPAKTPNQKPITLGTSPEPSRADHAISGLLKNHPEGLSREEILEAIKAKGFPEKKITDALDNPKSRFITLKDGKYFAKVKTQ